MKKELRYEQIDKHLLAREPRIVEVYTTSFPEFERMPLPFMLKRAKSKDIQFIAFYDEDLFVGLSYLITVRSKTYILYLAMDEKHRSKGYGSRVLDIIKKINKNQIIFLSIEEVDEKYSDFSIRNKRLDFYLRNGFSKNKFVVNERGHNFEVMSYKNSVSKVDYVDTISVLARPIPKFLVKLMYHNKIKDIENEDA